MGPDPLWRAKPVSYETAIQIWDAHDPIGTFKNRDFFRIYFRQNHHSDMVSLSKNLPEWLSYIKPLDNSFSGLLYNQFNNNPVGDFLRKK